MKKLSKILSILLVLALLIPGFAFAAKGELTDSNEEQKVALEKISEAIKANLSREKVPYDLEEFFGEKDKVRIIIELKSNPVIVYATQKGLQYSDMSMNTIDDIERKIENEQSILKNQISAKNIDMEYLNSFDTVFNGFSGLVEFEDIEIIERLPGVKKVYIANEYEKPIIKPDMNSSNDMIGSEDPWLDGIEGQGMVMAIIDTGIDPSHKDMNLSEDTVPKLTKDIVNEKDVPGKYYTDKVPYGYNYYDLNDEILDLGPGASEHGMHVAGIAGANGNPEENGVRGVAPEAQLLAMKVFSNDPIYQTTFSDIYIACIEDAIKLGADALNMSLGSPAGFYIEEDAANVAITQAVNNGIVCSISAGNSGQMTYGWSDTNYGYPWRENPDIGVVGTPGLSTDSIQVASIENTHMMAPYLYFEGVVSSEVLPINSVIVENSAYNIVYLNSNPEAQTHLIKTYNSEKPIYIKIDEVTIVDIHGEVIEDTNVLPGEVTYYDAEGNTSVRVPFGDGTGELTVIKVPMSIASSVNPADVFKDKVEFVDCGIGSTTDFEGKNIAGKLALVIRGGLTFVEKTMNAQNAGAAGIIIYNHESGGESLVNMAYPPEGKIPAVFIGHKGGKALLALENKLVSFSNEVMKVPNPSAGEMSDFTSWGTTPSLEMKPEITAPGGQIYSTLQNDKYGIMSGTSMAAPHVTGGSAIVMQYIKEHPVYSELPIGEQTKIAKQLIMNTAKVVLDPNGDEDEPISPRVQGAGLMNLSGAVNTPVRVVDNATNEGKVELKDFDSTSFTLKLKAINDSDSDVTYKINVDVLTDFIYPIGEDTLLNLLGARWLDAGVNDSGTITVPAKGSTQFNIDVDFSKDADIYRNMFVEGFVHLRDVNDEAPDLTIPYVGFYGKWDEPQILDGMLEIDEEGTSYFEASGMISIDDDYNGFYYDEVNLSPGTDDGIHFGTDHVVPFLSFMRNAEKVKYNILDKDDNLLRTIYTEDFVEKNYINGGRRSPVSLIEKARWDGKVNGEVVPEGEYFYEIQSKIHYADAEWQSKKIPVCIDITPPVLSELKYNTETGKLTWTAKDEGSGLSQFIILINDNGIDEVVTPEEGKENYEIDISKYIAEDGEYTIIVVAADKAMNTNSISIISTSTDKEKPVIYLVEPELLEAYDSNDITFTGYVTKNNNLKSVKINEKEVDFEWNENLVIVNPDDGEVIYRGPGYEFSKVLTLDDGVHETRVEATSIGGNTANVIRRFYVDTTDPELSITIKDREADSPTAELEINMKDNFPYFKLYLGDSEVYSHDGMTREIVLPPGDETTTITVNLKEGTNTFVFTLVDLVGHKVTKTIEIERTVERQPVGINY